MYKYFCLNPISPVGLEKFSDDYVPAGEMAGADAVLVPECMNWNLIKI